MAYGLTRPRSSAPSHLDPVTDNFQFSILRTDSFRLSGQSPLSRTAMVCVAWIGMNQWMDIELAPALTVSCIQLPTLQFSLWRDT